MEPSVTEVRMEHSFVWAESVAPQVPHLYRVDPSDSVAPPEQVTLMAAASHPGHEGREVHREGIEDLLVDDAALTLDVPPLPVVLADEFPGVIVRPLGDVVAADVEEVRNGSVTAQEGVERASGVVLETLEEILVILHDVERCADPALEEVVEIARLEKGLPEIADTGG